jgi:hypothetical protein
MAPANGSASITGSSPKSSRNVLRFNLPVRTERLAGIARQP